MREALFGEGHKVDTPPFTNNEKVGLPRSIHVALLYNRYVWKPHEGVKHTFSTLSTLPPVRILKRAVQPRSWALPRAIFIKM